MEKFHQLFMRLGALLVAGQGALQLGKSFTCGVQFVLSALAGGDCSELSEYRVDTGWIPAQPSGLRLELTVGAAADVIVEYTSRTRPD